MLDDEISVEEGKAEIKALDSRRNELNAQLKAADEPPPLLHPMIVDLYHSKVESLAEALAARGHAPRSLGDAPRAHRFDCCGSENGQLRLDLKGNLAAMLAAAHLPSRAKYGSALRRVHRSFSGGGQTKRSPETGDLIVPVQMVAGLATAATCNSGANAHSSCVG